MRKLVVLLALLAGCGGLSAQRQAADLVGVYVWDHDHPAFGGMSGIEITDDGTRFTAINDRGFLAHGTITRTDGRITGLIVDRMAKMRNMAGQRLTAAWSDSEGLAIGADGTISVSFEGKHRILQFTGPFTDASSSLIDPFFQTLQGNSSLEALAIGADGALYTLPERSGLATRPFPVLRFRGKTWEKAFEIPRRGTFLAAGADIGPDGLFYLLERDFTGIGFRTRIRRFDLTGAGEEVLLETANATHDNLEGISVWRDEAGDLIMTLIADDNFQFLQETEIVEYRIDG